MLFESTFMGMFISMFLMGLVTYFVQASRKGMAKEYEKERRQEEADRQWKEFINQPIEEE